MSVRPKLTNNIQSPNHLPLRVRKVAQTLLVANGPMSGMSLVSQVNNVIYKRKPTLQHVLEIAQRLKTMVAEGDIWQHNDMFAIVPKDADDVSHTDNTRSTNPTAHIINRCII